MFKDSVLTLLSPNKKVQQFDVDAQHNLRPAAHLYKDLLDETIAYYQTAHVLFTTHAMFDSGADRILNAREVEPQL